VSYVEPKQAGPRMSGLMLVVIFHIVLGYALVNGLARRIVEVVKAPLETKIIEEVKPPPPDKPPPPPPPKLAAPPPPYIPPPEIQIAAPQVQAPTITAVTQVKPTVDVPPPSRPAPPAPPPRPRAPTKTAAVVDAAACEKPAYPAASVRANETGVVRLNFLIETDGRVLESRVERSSGYRRLDEAARSALALCKFKPATTDGKPEKSWAQIDYEWKLE
jgi:protein TonB